VASSSRGAEPEAEVAAAFDLLPAIDLRGGRVVRLVEGDFERETAYRDDPPDVAAEFAAAGAPWLHVVDLDGARTGAPAHLEQIAAIVAAVGDRTRVEVAGGLRTLDAAGAALERGAARIVVGTAALANPRLAAALVAHHGPDRVVAALDVRAGLAVGEAWRAGAGGTAVGPALGMLADAGIETFEVTAIDRDGGLSGPDLDLLGRLVDLRHGAIIASGGIGSIADLVAVRQRGCAGAIVGRAIYDGRFSVAEALRALA
jgi:phosphoribosylformimino-5-aminoimidazole carboxamide ribotide isomerase